MGISQVPLPSGSASIPSDNWVLMSSVTPTAGATTVTFSSLAVRKKLMLRMNNFTTAASANVTVTFNGDTGAKYSIFGTAITPSAPPALATPLQVVDATGLVIGPSATGGAGVLTIEEADTTNIKNIWGYFRKVDPGNGVTYPDILGSYVASAAISSITITTASTFNAVGTIAVYGVSA
jgi:hypothetical protein